MKEMTQRIVGGKKRLWDIGKKIKVA